MLEFLNSYFGLFDGVVEFCYSHFYLSLFYFIFELAEVAPDFNYDLGLIGKFYCFRSSDI